jgi:cytochrome P450
MELVMVCSPAALKELLVTRCYEYEKPTPLLRLALQFFGPGMPFVEGDTHKHQRKMMAPAFSFKHIKDLYPTFWELSRDISNILVGEVKKAAGEPHTTNGISYQVAPDQAVVEIVAWWKKITLDIMGVAGMGHDFEGRKHDENELCQAYYKMFRPTWGHAISTFIRIVVPLWMFPYIPLPQNHTIEESRHTINNHCRMLIRQKKAQLAEGKLTDLDILSCAIQSGAFDEETLVPQITIFLLAGHESSSVAMSWATYALAQYPEVQKRLREEVRAVLPSPYGSEPVTSLDIDKVPYITAVCNEVMRFYDVFVWTFREARVDTELVGQRIPKGTQLVVPVASIHRDRSIWGDDADVFNPDRWMEKRNAGVSTNFAVMTFIHGPRTCIGESFARAEFACLLAAFAGRFEWELNDPRELVDENYKLAGGFGVGPVNGLDIRLRVVDGW